LKAALVTRTTTFHANPLWLTWPFRTSPGFDKNTSHNPPARGFFNTKKADKEGFGAQQGKGTRRKGCHGMGDKVLKTDEGALTKNSHTRRNPQRRPEAGCGIQTRPRDWSRRTRKEGIVVHSTRSDSRGERSIRTPETQGRLGRLTEKSRGASKRKTPKPALGRNGLIKLGGGE